MEGAPRGRVGLRRSGLTSEGEIGYYADLSQLAGKGSDFGERTVGLFLPVRLCLCQWTVLVGTVVGGGRQLTPLT